MTSEDSPETSAFFGGGERPAAAGGEAAVADEIPSADRNDGGGFDDGIPEINEDDIEQSIARIRDEVLALSGLGGDGEHPVVAGGSEAAAPDVVPAAEPDKKKKPAATKKPAAKKNTAKKPEDKKAAVSKPKKDSAPAASGVIVFEDFDEDESGDEVTYAPDRYEPIDDVAATIDSYYEDQSSLASHHYFANNQNYDAADDEEEHILFDDGSHDENDRPLNPIILFEDVDDDELAEGEAPVVLFEDVDDTYLNQVDLVDRRLEMLRKGSGVDATGADKLPEEPQIGGVIEFIDEEEVPAGKDLLDHDVDTLIKQLLRRSKKRQEKVIPIEEFNLDDVSSWLDYKGDDPEKAQAIAEIDGLIKHASADPLLYNIFNAVAGGQNSVVHSVKSEAITLDSEWITTIEDGLYFIEDIVKNPKKFIIDNEIIMEVERARKTNSKTVRHLAQNTKNISKIDDDGFVTPKKVLTVEMDEDLAIYENRFVCTLVNRLTAFVESRKADIQSKFRIYDISQISMNSRFKYGPGEVECNFSVAVKEPPKDNVLLDKAMYLVNKINDISKRLRILRNSEFIRKLSAMKPIVPPISKTNIIKMNVNYSTCYKLWLFISAYTMVGYSVEVKEKRLPVNGSYFDDLSALTALSMRSLIDHEILNRDTYTRIEAKPPKTKRFKVVPDFSMTHAAKDHSVEVHDEAINEYYFRKMQEAFEEKIPAPAADEDEEEVAIKDNRTIVEKRNININYERYCKTLINVSNELLSDSIKSDEAKDSIIRVDALKRKKREFDKQKNMLKKYSTIAKLKASDLEKTLFEEARQEIKLEKLSRELELLEARAEKRRVRRKKLAAKKAEDNRKEKAVKKAAEYKQALTEKMEEERLAEEQKKEDKREQRKREKELRLLAELQYKYKDELED